MLIQSSRITLVVVLVANRKIKLFYRNFKRRQFNILRRRARKFLFGRRSQQCLYKREKRERDQAIFKLKDEEMKEVEHEDDDELNSI